MSFFKTDFILTEHTEINLVKNRNANVTNNIVRKGNDTLMKSNII